MNFLLLFTNSLPPSDKSELVLDWTNYFQHKYIQKEWKSIWKEMVLVFTLPFYWCAWSLSRVQLLATPCTVAHQGPSVHGILQARVLEWAAMPSPRDLPYPGIEPRSPALQGILYRLRHQRGPPYTEIHLKIWQSGGREAPKGGDICINIADSCGSTADHNTTLKNN